MIKHLFSRTLPEEAKKIRTEVFVKEQGFVDEFGEQDNNAIHLVLFLDDVPIATGRFYFEDPETAHIGRVAVRKPYRNQGVGRGVMQFLEFKARELGARKAVLDAQLDKADFYRAVGYKEQTGEVFLEEDYPHIRMIKILAKPRSNKKKGSRRA